MSRLPSCTVIVIVAMAPLGACGDRTDQPSDVDASATTPAITPATDRGGTGSGLGFNLVRGVPVQFRVVRAVGSDVCPEVVDDNCDLVEVDCEDPPAAVTPTEVVGLCDLADPPVRYRLAPAEIVGGVESADYAIPQKLDQYVVTFTLADEQAARFVRLSRELTPDVDQFAIVVGGRVVSAPTFATPIPGAKAQITGDFSEDEARDLAEALRSGG